VESTKQSNVATDLLGDLAFSDYLKIAKRRKWWIILSLVGALTAAIAYAFSSPNLYHSQTVILVDPQQVTTPYVAPITTSVADRLSTVRQEVLSPTRLSTLIHDLNLYPQLVRGGNEDNVVSSMQKAISVDVADSGSQRLSAFKIGYTGRNAAEVAKIANQLAVMVIRENLRVRESQSTDTRQFFEAELAETKKQLETKETELGRIKSANSSELPEAKQFHLEALSNLRVQMNASEDRVSRDQQQKVYLQSMVASSAPTVDMDAENGSQAASPYQAQIGKLESHLAELRNRYGPGYPEVRKVQKELDAAKAKAKQDEQDGPPAPVAPLQKNRPVVKNPVIEAQITKLDQEIEEQTKLQKGLQQQIDFHAAKLENEPVFEQRISNLMRDYETLRTHYNQILDKKLAADMASELEDRQKGDRFVVLDHATMATSPTSPKRPLLAVAGLAAGLALGLGLAFVVELTDQTVRSEKEAAELVGQSAVLAGIPEIVSVHAVRKYRALAVCGLMATILLASGLGLTASYLTRQLI
jgi:polysaccharide chain length determinant protein (PEP-CTERM system associated)